MSAEGQLSRAQRAGQVGSKDPPADVPFAGQAGPPRREYLRVTYDPKFLGMLPADSLEAEANPAAKMTS
jgi:hypothetical protein